MFKSAGFCVLLALALVFFSCAPEGDSNKKKGEIHSKDQVIGTLALPFGKAIDGAPEGEKLLVKYCQGCHILPKISAYSKQDWEKIILPNKGAILGMHHAGLPYDSLVDNGLRREAHLAIEKAKVYANSARMSKKDWKTLNNYILSLSPNEIAPNEQVIESHLFESSSFSITQNPALTTILQSTKSGFWYGDLRSDSLINYDFHGKMLSNLKLREPVNFMVEKNDKIWLSFPGDYFASDNPNGKIGYIKLDSLGMPTGEPIVWKEELHRPAALIIEDLNNDGQDDIILAQNGKQVGLLTVFWATENGYKTEMLANESGFEQLKWIDLDGDKEFELIALQTGRNNAIQMFACEDGVWSRHLIKAFQPHQQLSHIEVEDMNGDGLLDLVVAFGNRTRYGRMNKAENGLQILFAKGNGNYEPSEILEQKGVTDFVIADFDNDGDKDLVSMAYYAPFASMQNTLIYWQNNGNQFSGNLISTLLPYRYKAITRADVDADGDLDILLGGFVFGPESPEDETLVKWRNETPSITILKNAVP
ncbi:MAG: VCBS repeat-containing protein [Bacteroidetes bacterium]|nr:VCBS repeat-containing protein [Bacteroidota bacterium]